MSLLIAVAVLFFLTFVDYAGFSLIVSASVAALLAVLLTDLAGVSPISTGLFMDKRVFPKTSLEDLEFNEINDVEWYPDLRICWR